MPDQRTWKELFDGHAPRYSENVFTKWTSTEVTFLEEICSLSPGNSVLDIGCGVGRHSIELAKRGYKATGVDISPGMLDEARSNSLEASVEVELIESDACTFRNSRLYDLVVCLCEGGFGLVNPGEDPIGHDLAILRTAFEHLKPGGWFVLTALNGYMTIRQMTDEAVAAGAFDPASMVSHYQDTWKLPEGEQQIVIRERLFIPPEIVALLRHVGFEVVNIWGGTAGEWGKRPIKLDEIEAMFVARKPA